MIRSLLGQPADSLLLTIAVQITFLAAASLLISRFVRGCALRHSILAAGMIAILTAPLALAVTRSAGLTLRVPILSEDDGPRNNDTVPVPVVISDMPHTEEAETQPSFSVVEATHSSTPTDAVSTTNRNVAPDTTTARAATIPWTTAAAATWFALTFLLLAGVVRAVWRGQAIGRRTEAVDPQSRRDATTEAARRLLVQRYPLIRLTKLMMMPAAAGFLRPFVIIPQRDWKSLADEELVQVLVHEGAHAIRRDPLWILLQRVAGAVFWWHPLVHLLNRRMDLAREEVCDNYVLRDTPAEAYGGTLLRFARHSLAAPAGIFSPGLLDGAGPLEHRIAGILDERRNRAVRAPRSIAATAIMLMASLSLVVASARAVALPDDVAGQVPVIDDTPTEIEVSDDFSIKVLYHGDSDKPYYQLLLHRSLVAIEDAPGTFSQEIDAQQAARIHEHLLAAGFYDRADEVADDEPAIAGQGYLIQVTTENQLLREDLGWDLGTLIRLDALRACLDGESADAMDLLLERLTGHRGEWETAEVDSGLTSRLTSDATSFPAGHPVPLTLEVANVSDRSRLLFKVLVSVNDTFDVRNEYGQLMPYLCGYSSVTPTAVALPAGDAKTIEEFDLAECYHLRRPGRYTVQYRGDDLRPRSDCLHFEITSDPAGTADGDPVGRLLPLVREGWTFGAGPSVPYPLRPGSNWSEVNCRPITFIFNGPAYRDDAGMINICLATEPATAEVHPESSLPTTEYLGQVDRWHVYWLISENALQAWPDAQADIVAALGGDAVATAAAVPEQVEGQQPSGQQQLREQAFEVERIHPSMQESQVWLDLRGRLKQSAVRFRLVEIDENGRIRLSLASTPATDLSHLQGMPISSLDLSHTGVRDLSPLAGMPLEILDVSGSQVVDLTPLSGMKLQRLDILGLAVRDLSPLRDAELVSLVAIGAPIEDLSPLSGMPLEYLDLRRSRVSDLSPLAGLPLESIQIEDSPISDLTPLRETPVTTLWLSGIADLDLSQLSGIPLRRLVLMGPDVADVSALQGMQIEALSLENSSVTDLTPITSLPLHTLSLMGTHISDLSPLAGMSLKNVYLSEPGTDLTPLAAMPLETIALPPIETVVNLELLREMESLQWIRPPDCKPMTPTEFWQMVDSEQDAD